MKLSVPQLAPLVTERSYPMIARRLLPFRASGVLQGVDVHVVDHLAALVGETDPDVLLALALSVRAPRHGHICVDLASTTADELLPEPDETQAASGVSLELPSDRLAWVETVGRSKLVGGRDDAAKPFVLDGTWLYPARYFAYQRRLAEALRGRMTRLQPWVDPALLQRGLRALFGNETSGQPIDRQKLAAAMALLRGFTVVSGGPGTGKTYAVRSVLTLLWAQWASRTGDPPGTPGPRTALAAPTGKAASRMKEALLAGLDEFLAGAGPALASDQDLARLRDYLVGLQPCTLHRLLEWNPASPTRFRHNAANPLRADIVVVDETSMVDFALMTKLVDAVAPEARLVLLGDQHQLASVEAGTVLADLCGPTSVSNVTVSRGFAEELRDIAGMAEVLEAGRLSAEPGPYDAIVQLDRSRRFTPGSGIGLFARACLADDFDPRRAVQSLTSSGPDSDVTLLGHGPHGTVPDAAARIIAQGYAPYLERLLAGPQHGETHAQLHVDVLRLFDRFRVLCAHRAGRLGVAGINRVVVDLLSGRTAAGSADTARHRARPRLAGFSPVGEFWVGRPVLIVRNDYVVRLFNGDVGIVVPDDGGALQVAFPDADGVRYVAPARLPEHQTVFAMTIHKSQGSEFDHAMVVLPERASAVLTRELIYTGVTRARHRVTLLCDGARSVLLAGLAATVRRASGLRAEVWGTSV